MNEIYVVIGVLCICIIVGVCKLCMHLSDVRNLKKQLNKSRDFKMAVCRHLDTSYLYGDEHILKELNAKIIKAKQFDRLVELGGGCSIYGFLQWAMLCYGCRFVDNKGNDLPYDTEFRFLIQWWLGKGEDE